MIVELLKNINPYNSDISCSHKAWVSAVQWSPTDPYVLASSSHDGTVKVWDIRSSIPLHTAKAHSKGSKALCLSFADDAIYSGGSDCVVKRFKF
jgi:ribosome biogenesis protein YTM1